MANTEAEAKKQDLAWWHKGSVVEMEFIQLRRDEQGECRDPNRYTARCLTSGTWPTLEIINEEGVRDARFPLPFEKGTYIIWRELAREFRPKQAADYINEREVVCYKTGEKLNVWAFGNGLIRWVCSCGARYEKKFEELPEMPERVELRIIDGCQHWRRTFSESDES